MLQDLLLDSIRMAWDQFVAKAATQTEGPAEARPRGHLVVYVPTGWPEPKELDPKDAMAFLCGHRLQAAETLDEPTEDLSAFISQLYQSLRPSRLPGPPRPSLPPASAEAGTPYEAELEAERLKSELIAARREIKTLRA